VRTNKGQGGGVVAGCGGWRVGHCRTCHQSGAGGGCRGGGGLCVQEDEGGVLVVGVDGSTLQDMPSGESRHVHGDSKCADLIAVVHR
jgi:hypothetical protein